MEVYTSLSRNNIHVTIAPTQPYTTNPHDSNTTPKYPLTESNRHAQAPKPALEPHLPPLAGLSTSITTHLKL